MNAVPDAFIRAAREQNIKVFIDEGGVSIAREARIDGMIYARALDVTDRTHHREKWPQLFARLDREFAALLASHGFISLPDEYRTASA